MTPFKPSGVRLGTPAVTSRGMKEKEMRLIAQFIYDLIVIKTNPAKIKLAVENLCKKFPIGIISKAH